MCTCMVACGLLWGNVIMSEELNTEHVELRTGMQDNENTSNTC